MINEYYESGQESGIDLKCDKQCRVLGGRDWQTLLPTIKDSIVFIDEDNDFWATDEFARNVRESDNYFCLVTIIVMMIREWRMTILSILFIIIA